MDGFARLATVATAALLFTGAAPPVPTAVGNGAAFGTWTNPKESVRVQGRPCGPTICGYVFFATDEAKTKAAKGGTKALMGIQLFHHVVQTSPTGWKGKVFAPDIDKTFSGTMTLIAPNQLKIRGCLIAGVGCKSQTWTRVT